jgi:hypothetical protein
LGTSKTARPAMNKDPMEMTIEELDVVYGKPHLFTTITHVLQCVSVGGHDRFTVEIITEDSQRLNIQFTQEALRNLMRLIDVEGSLGVDRPKAN